MTTPEPDDALVESLRLARRELKLARREQEAAVETLQQVRRQRAALREDVRLYSDALAARLSRDWWADHESASGPAAVAGSDDDPALVAEVEASGFDAGAYLRRHPELIDAGTSPAVHFLRSGGDAQHVGPDVDPARG